MDSTSNDRSGLSRRKFLGAAAGVGAGAMLGGLPDALARVGSRAAAKSSYKMRFIQFIPHTVPTAWSKGISDVTKVQKNIDYKLLDGQGKAEVQASLVDAALNEGVDVLFLQPVDSVAIGSSIKKAWDAGVPVITLNIDATQQHAAHVEMNHVYGAIEIGKQMGRIMKGKGEVAILNAPPGIIIRDQRTNGFKKGISQYPGIKIVADQNAEWDRKKAQDVLSAILVAHPNVRGVFGVNDSMALGAVDILKSKNLLKKVTVFGDDGETDALESIAKGELTGTQYTDVYQQGRLAAAVAVGFASGGVSAKQVLQQAHLLMPYTVVTKKNVATIRPDQRW